MKCIALSRCHRDNARIAYTTRKWKLSKNWHQERVAFDCFQILGYLKIYTDRCNKQKLCASILTLVKLKTSAVLHGLLYEAGARQTFNARIGPKIQTCGLFITIIWLLLLLVLLAKLPNLKLHVTLMIEIVKLLQTFFRFHLKQNHSYHIQAQGQLNVCKEVFLCCLLVLGHIC